MVNGTEIVKSKIFPLKISQLLFPFSLFANGIQPILKFSVNDNQLG